MLTCDRHSERRTDGSARNQTKPSPWQGWAPESECPGRRWRYYELVDRLRRGGWFRNLFFGIVAVAVALLLLIRYLILPVLAHHPIPNFADDLGAVDDLLLVTLLGSVLVITFLVFFLPGPRTSDRMMELEAHRIGNILRDGVDEATEWWYSGNSGRHFRAKMLPRLGDRAKKRRRSISVHLMILDPTSARSCDTYSTY